MKILVGALTTILVVLYPIAIWVGLTHFRPRVVGLVILAVLAGGVLYRLRRARREDLLALLRIPLVVGAVAGSAALFDDRRALLLTPVLVSLALLSTFALSLRGTPIVERFARMQEPEGLSEAQVRHCRQVTWAWILFFLLNGSVAAVLALDESWVGAWAAYNGGIAYALMGLMFAGEYVLRQYRFRRYGRGLHDRVLSRIFPPREDTP